MKLMKLQANEATLGFTLVEILVVVGLLALVSFLAIVPFTSFRDAKSLDGAAEDALSLLHEAQTRTLSSDGASPYGVYFESDKITLFKGETFVVGAPDNKEISLHNRLTISAIALAGGASAVFKRLTGATDNSGTVTISLVSDTAQKRIITISAAGSFSLN